MLKGAYNKYIAISPQGNLKSFYYQSKFARNHDLRDSCIRATINNEHEHHQGWHFFKFEDWFNLSEKEKEYYLTPKYTGIDPKNNEYKFNHQTNFAKKHGLDNAAIYRCLSNKQGSHKGWKFFKNK